ncbi:MAG: TIR domain-containing protein [Candidatus Competibacter sp.]|nr:TIR domain-containing protein [Candidatus Competibacter sp.]MDG4585812.1 TIR domain-containing protein [Candidatus Competibacter sp.]
MATASIFISHAHADAAFAQDLGLALETYRLSVWHDARGLRGGERLAPEVRWAIEQARQVIVVLGLNTGDPAWLRREIEIAQKTERRRASTYRVIPLLLPGVDLAVINHWFTPPPQTAPIQLSTEGLGVVLPGLLTALGVPLPGETTTDRNRPPLAELELLFSQADPTAPDGWLLTARLSHHPLRAPVTVNAAIDSLPRPPDPRILHWYLQEHLCWPTDTVRQFARRTDTFLASWGHALYQTTLGAPGLRDLTTAWRADPDAHDRRLVIRADAVPATAATVLDLPWELLHDETGFLLQGKQPVQFQRRLSGGGDLFSPDPPPLRVLAISPRPDMEPTGHPDYRCHSLPLLEALENLGGLMEMQLLNPPTLATLEKRLNDAWSAGRPFTALHLSGYLRHDPDQDSAVFGFEASYDLHAPLCRDIHFVPAAALASLLATYRIRLVVLACSRDGAAAVSGLASTLLAAGIAATITVHSSTPTETLRRFWAAFYKELLRGSRISQALFAGHRQLASDSYRTAGLGGGGVYLQDWPTCILYLGQHDPRLALRPPLDLWRRLLDRPRLGPPESLPDPSPVGCIGRGQDLLILERLFENHTSVFLRGSGGSGKTAAAVALARWQARCGRYRHVAYIRANDADDTRTLLEALGRQLLSEGKHWSVTRYPTQWQALDHLRQTLRTEPVLIVLDQLEQWPSEQDEALDQFWKQLLDDWSELRLLGLGRIGPPSFAQPWTETVLSPLSESDAITLIGQTLIEAREIPPNTDSGESFRQLRDVATLAGGHPGALRRLAHEIGVLGVGAALKLLRPLRAELLRLHSDDPQWPLYLSMELTLRRLSSQNREQLTVLAFCREGINRIALGHALGFDTLATDAFCTRITDLGLAEDQGYGHLRFDPALTHYLSSQLDPNKRLTWQARWRAGMERLLAVLYQQYFKDNARATRLLRLELPNLLALLRDHTQHAAHERVAQIAAQLEHMLADLGFPIALAEVVAARERAGQALLGWSRARFETERLNVERLRNDGALEDALQAARRMLSLCQDAGADAYPGATYDLARAHFQLGKLLKLAEAAEPASRELTAARQLFQTLAEAGNDNAGRMAAVADAENGDCLTYLRRLQEAADAYEAALAHAGPNPNNGTFATNNMQLGLVRQRQGRYGEAAKLYDTARRTFEALGEPDGAAQAWRQLGLARKMSREIEPALHACQQALYLYEQQRNRSGVAETLGELGHLHQVLNQLEPAALSYRRMAELYRELGDGHSEEASRNKLANVLIQLRRHDEARQELYRASECNLPESPTARNWAIRRGLRDFGQAVQNPSVADQARRQAIQKYLAYRRAGGENTNPGTRLCAQVGQAIQAGDASALATKLEQIAASPNVPSAGRLLIAKLQAILAGSRDPELATDPELHYQYAVEIQLLLEYLASH